MTATRLIEALNSTGYTVRSYSGRGMDGIQCLGITVQDFNSIFAIASDLIDAGFNSTDLHRLSGTMCHDAQGKRSVIYWPHLVLTESDIRLINDED